MDFHPVCKMFPEMTKQEFQAFTEDIAKNGQRDPIWTYEGQVIDGRHRYKACHMLGRVPLTREWDGNGSLTAFVVSLNLHRRHLDTSQRAGVAVAVKEGLEEEGRRRKSEAGVVAAAKRWVPANLPEPMEDDNDDGWESRDEAARLLNVSPRMVTDAEFVKDHDPDAFEDVKAGRVTVHAAKKAITGTTTRTTRVEVLEATAVYLDSQPSNLIKWMACEMKAGRLSIHSVVCYRDAIDDLIRRVSEVD
jgi:hypothetical protein